MRALSRKPKKIMMSNFLIVRAETVSAIKLQKSFSCPVLAGIA